MAENVTDLVGLFPYDSLYLVAPFLAYIDIGNGIGNISYQVYSNGSPLLDTVNSIISNEETTNFIGHWMLVAEWNSVPEYYTGSSQVGSILVL